MDDVSRAFRDLTAMISAERDARRADVREIRSHIKAIENRLVAMDDRMGEADERTSGFEQAMLDTLGTIHDSVVKTASGQKSLEERVSALEQWRRDQAS